MDLNQPLAHRVRPKTLEEFFGQEHILGKDKLGVLRRDTRYGDARYRNGSCRMDFGLSCILVTRNLYLTVTPKFAPSQ